MTLDRKGHDDQIQTCRSYHRYSCHLEGYHGHDDHGMGYPLSATIASEFVLTNSRGCLLLTVFTAQGRGDLGTTVSFLHGNRGRSIHPS
jgi:hypothetical protein